MRIKVPAYPRPPFGWRSDDAPNPAFPRCSPPRLSALTPLSVPDDLLNSMSFRLVGPFRGGRVTAVTGVPGDPMTYYMGSTGGGVWKTSNAGVSWRNVTDSVRELDPVEEARIMGQVDPELVEAGVIRPPAEGLSQGPRRERRAGDRLRLGVHRGGCGGDLRSERRLGGHRLGVSSRQCLLRRRRLQIHRCRRHLAPHGTRRGRSDRPGHRASDRPGCRLCRRPGEHLRRQ